MELGFTWEWEITIGPKLDPADYTWKLPVLSKPIYRKPKQVVKKIKDPNAPVVPKKKYIYPKDYSTELIECETCKCYFQKRIKSQHKRTKKHIKNLE